MRLDVGTLEVKTLTIDGILRVDDNQDLGKVTIKAKHIWVRGGGEFLAGYEKDPFKNELEIILTGSKNSEQLIIDDYFTPSNKVLAVTGLMSFYGKYPETIHTRLTKFAHP